MNTPNNPDYYKVLRNIWNEERYQEHTKIIVPAGAIVVKLSRDDEAKKMDVRVSSELDTTIDYHDLYPLFDAPFLPQPVSFWKVIDDIPYTDHESDDLLFKKDQIVICLHRDADGMAVQDLQHRAEAYLPHTLFEREWDIYGEALRTYERNEPAEFPYGEFPNYAEVRGIYE